jgi:hypothetical protein
VTTSDKKISRRVEESRPFAQAGANPLVAGKYDTTTTTCYHFAALPWLVKSVFCTE